MDLLPQVRVPAQRPPLGVDEVLVSGAVSHEWVITTPDLHAHAGLPVDVHYVTTRRREVHHVQGVPLHQVLRRTSLLLDDRRKMDHLNFVVQARSEDGFQVLLSWAEVDPEFGGCSALLATRYNGEVLTRPTLVVPTDGRSSRYVRRLCHLRLVRVED